MGIFAAGCESFTLLKSSVKMVIGTQKVTKEDSKKTFLRPINRDGWVTEQHV